jgi:hypothetical protein
MRNFTGKLFTRTSNYHSTKSFNICRLQYIICLAHSLPSPVMGYIVNRSRLVAHYAAVMDTFPIFPFFLLSCSFRLFLSPSADSILFPSRPIAYALIGNAKRKNGTMKVNAGKKHCTKVLQMQTPVTDMRMLSLTCA